MTAQDSSRYGTHNESRWPQNERVQIAKIRGIIAPHNESDPMRVYRHKQCRRSRLDRVIIAQQRAR